VRRVDGRAETALDKRTGVGITMDWCTGFTIIACVFCVSWAAICIAMFYFSMKEDKK
jgi:hypothetical protein